MRISTLILTVVAAILVHSHAADAGAPTITNRLWNTTGNGCTIADESVSYDSRGAGIGFTAGVTGTIRMYCPVAVSTNGTTPSVTGFGVTYNHPTTNGANATITFTFHQLNDASNSTSSTCSFSSTATGITEDSCGFLTTHFSKTATYFLEVVLTRSNTNVDPEFLTAFVYN